MWNPFVVDNCNYLIKCTDLPVVKICLTDFKTLWIEEIESQELITRFQELNPLFDVSSLNSGEILHKVFLLINDIKPESSVTLTKETGRIILDLKCKLEEFSIRCKFDLPEASSEIYFREFTVPLMQSVQYLEMRQKKLFDLLEKKDKEILEHQLEGGEISRKSLITTKFDRSTAMENIPEQLFVSVFGKSKEFYETFNKSFGSVTSISPKIKIEKTEEKPRKKFKVEKPKF